jgi:V8-like Glu-specific endopeptidase
MSIRSFTCLVTLIVCLAVPADAQTAVGRQKVGEIEPFAMSTSHPYAGGLDHEYVIHHPGATYIKAHFSRFDLAEGDRLVVSNPDGTERYVFTARGYKNMGADFWVTSVLGDTAILRLESTNSAGGYGFDVDHYAWGFADLFPGPYDPQSVCGANNWMDAECYATSYPTEYDRAKRAVVVLYNGNENCTGVKVGCPNQIMSNEHCVTSQGDVNVTEVRFEYQRADCNGATDSFSEAYLGDTFQQDNYTLDYSIFTVQGASDNYEAAEFDPRLPPVGERLYITGHPAGNPKKLSIEDDQSPTGLCRVDVSPQNGRGTDSDIGYLCDTTGGSSGSPVWSGDTHKLIALHHFGGCYNGGVRIDLIYPEVEPIIMSCCDNPPGAPTVSAAANGDNRIDVDWDDSDLASVVEYEVKRSRTPGGPYETLATIADTSLGSAGGAGYSFSDTDVSGGITYYYTVESTDGVTCTSLPAAEASASATGACTLEPVFAGAQSVSVPGSSICTLDVTWAPATAECGGPIVYNVHRSTVAGFTPSGSNVVASGLASTAFQDINQLVQAQTYFYKVRAIDTANGVEDTNLVDRGAQPANGCTTASACPENPFVNVAPEGPLTVCVNGGPALSADLTGGTGPFHYQWLRDGLPVPGANAETYAPNDLGTHVYNVRVRADACPDEVFDGVSTELARVERPFFAGIESAVNPEIDTCTANLNWSSATTVCNGPIEYVVYRDTVTPVAQVPSNIVIGGLTGTAYVDVEALANEQLYHYNVQARDASTGQFDGNLVEASVVTDGPFNGLQPAYLEDFEDAATFANWTVTTGPGAHSCGEFALSSNSGKRPTGGTGSYLIADNECSPILPRTSTIAESPAMSMIIPGVQAVFLEADIQFDYASVNGSEDASVEVWDGSQWVAVWTDSNSDFDGSISIDVSAHALGNTGFKVRFSYQNASADRHFSVDNVAFVTDVMSVCSTAPAGPAPIGVGSLVVGRAPGAADTIDLAWDATCGSANYNLLYGDLADVSMYTLQGATCSIGAGGGHSWTGVPGGNLFFLVVGTDGASTESSWGRDSGHRERNAIGSSQCGMSALDSTGVCP